jgi:hypothetical protein
MSVRVFLFLFVLSSCLLDTHFFFFCFFSTDNDTDSDAGVLFPSVQISHSWTAMGRWRVVFQMMYVGVGSSHQARYTLCTYVSNTSALDRDPLVRRVPSAR